VLVDYWRLQMGAGVLRGLLDLPTYLRFRPALVARQQLS